jgi:hypothetical protein
VETRPIGDEAGAIVVRPAAAGRMAAMRSSPVPRSHSRSAAQDIDKECLFLLAAYRRRNRRKAGIFAAILSAPCYICAPSGEREGPVRVRRTALKEHKFQIGETVYFTSRPIGHMIANSAYEVVKLLPSDGSDYQYRIKNANEAFERVARESQLEYTG